MRKIREVTCKTEKKAIYKMEKISKVENKVRSKSLQENIKELPRTL